MAISLKNYLSIHMGILEQQELGHLKVSGVAGFNGCRWICEYVCMCIYIYIYIYIYRIPFQNADFLKKKC